MIAVSYVVPCETEDGLIRPRAATKINEGTPHLVFTTQTEVLAESDEEAEFLASIGNSLALGEMVSPDIGDTVAAALVRDLR